MDELFDYQTSSGVGRVIYNRRGVRRLILPQQAAAAGETSGSVKSSPFPPFVATLKQALKDYFSGTEVDFSSVPVDLTGFSAFEREVYRITRMIPCGEKRSYSWVAKEIGYPRSYRAVGRALSKNQALIIVPCHRVVKEGGSSGGWSGPPGWKKKLLRLELNRREDR